ncbi:MULTISPECIES: hypothetical protein [Flavobacteriaceae]|uniref:hypothetical protein n=1 Tax=Flavobacteriaceae TaxID=49546 RepID=UPI00234BE0D3|nr:hypothetical protein [Muricauda sp. SP22]MDC6361856.1 hypothetical protein [Muricauda sp. SP22]
MISPIAMGKISRDGKIIKATPGIKVKNIKPIDINSQERYGYLISLPDRLVKDSDYIVQLTAENFGENGPDFTVTSIALRYQTKKNFEVIIWGDRVQSGLKMETVKSNWHFVIYDI